MPFWLLEAVLVIAKPGAKMLVLEVESG